MSKREYKKIRGEIKTTHFAFDICSPQYAKENELYFSPNLYNDTLKGIKIINVIPYIPNKNDTLKSTDMRHFTYRGNIKKENRLNLFLQYTFIGNSKRDTITEYYELKRIKGCMFTVH